MLSFEAGATAVVIGASGGIGAALVDALLEDCTFEIVYALARKFEAGESGRLRRGPIDVGDETNIAAALSNLKRVVRLVIVATGVLHGDGVLQPEKSYRSLDPVALAEIFRINTIGPALVAKHVLPRMAPRGRCVFAALSARVGSIGDNRAGGWHGYRALKAALNMMIRNLAIETARLRPETLCVGLHPGTVDTGLSKPFQRNVAEGKLFTPAYSASRLLQVVDGLSGADNGHVLAWDASTVPP